MYALKASDRSTRNTSTNNWPSRTRRFEGVSIIRQSATRAFSPPDRLEIFLFTFKVLKYGRKKSERVKESNEGWSHAWSKLKQEGKE